MTKAVFVPLKLKTTRQKEVFDSQSRSPEKNQRAIINLVLVDNRKRKEKTVKRFSLTLVVLIVLISGSAWGQATPTSDGFQMPYKGNPTQTCDFGSLSCFHPGQYHLGEDYELAVGDTIFACSSGVVKEARYSDGYGGIVLIEHLLSSGEYVVSLCAHMLSSTIEVSVGDIVVQGQIIGYIAQSGDNGGPYNPHVHFGMHVGSYDDTPSLSCDEEGWAYQGYSYDECTLSEWYDPSDLVDANHSFIGYFDDGWHDDGISEAFLNAHRDFINSPNNSEHQSLGIPHDNSGGEFVHLFYNMYIQDFYGANNGLDHPYTSLIRGQGSEDGVYLLKDAFWAYWMNNAGWLDCGYPISDEEECVDVAGYTVQQRFMSPYGEVRLLWGESRETYLWAASQGPIECQDTQFQCVINNKVAGDGVYHSGYFVTDFNEPIKLVEGRTYGDFYAVVSGVDIPIDPFTVSGSMTIPVGGELSPSPCVVGSAVTYSAEGVAISGNYAYVADNIEGLKVFDVSNPSTPTLVGSSGAGTSVAMGLAISGNYAYVVDNGVSGFKVLDISNPNNPAIVGSNSEVQNSREVVVSGNYAYVANNSSSGLKIVNISDPTNPVLAGSFFTDYYGYKQGVAVSGDYAYLAITSGALWVINISNPSNPVSTHIVGMHSPNDVYVSGNYAYVADAEEGLKIVDISDPSHAGIVGSVDTSEFANSVYVSGNYAYVGDYLAGSSGGLTVVNISDPTNPVIVAEAEADDARDVVGFGSYLYVADDTEGFKVYEKNCGITTVDANFGADPLTGNVPLTVDFQDYSTGYPTSWLWDFGNGDTSTAQNPSHTYSMHGYYTVTLTVGNGETSDTLVLTDLIRGTKPPTPPEDPVYPYCEPNPSNPVSVISYKLDKPAHVDLAIYDVRGRKVRSLVDQNMGMGVHKATFDGVRLASGVYFYRLDIDGKVTVNKLTLVK